MYSIGGYIEAWRGGIVDNGKSCSTTNRRYDIMTTLDAVCTFAHRQFGNDDNAMDFVSWYMDKWNDAQRDGHDIGNIPFSTMLRQYEEREAPRYQAYTVRV